MITDTFLLKEIGCRQEITSSMVARAEVKRTRARSQDAWFYGVGNRGVQDAAQARQQQQWGSPSFLGSWGLLGGLGGGVFQSSKCPYCGK